MAPGCDGNRWEPIGSRLRIAPEGSFEKKELVMRRVLLLVAVAALMVAGSAPALASGRPLTAELVGSTEVPVAGDPDGMGHATVTLNQGLGEVCWDIMVADIATPRAAHIHIGEAGVAGGVVVGLTPGSGCVDGVDADLIKDIRQNPSNYYVNVHNAEFPGGALRGQLSK